MIDAKFRAWDKTRNIYGQVLKLERPCGEMDMDFCGHAGRLSLFNPKNEYDCGFWGIWIEKADLEQFTGLHDKNGKEIFEGDIVHAIDHPTDVFTCDDYIILQSGMFCLSTHTADPLVNYGQHWLEIIGNIHENPELLHD